MTAFLNINWGGVQVDALTLTLDEEHATDVYYSINLEDLLAMTEPRDDQRRRRRRYHQFLDRIGDPKHGFPILRQLIETFGPTAVQYFLTQINTWLTNIQDDDEPTSVA